MPKPTNKNAEQDLKKLTENMYAASMPKVDGKSVRFHMEVPMLQQADDGKQLHLPMVVLNPREENEAEVKAVIETEAAFGKVPKKDDATFDNFQKVLDNNRAAWIIFFATRLPTDLTKKWFMDKKQVEDTYTLEELATLGNNYITVKLNQPHYKAFDPNDPNAFQTIIDKIKSDAENSSFFLNGLTTHTVNQLLKYLVLQLPNSQKDNGSSGEQ